MYLTLLAMCETVSVRKERFIHCSNISCLNIYFGLQLVGYTELQPLDTIYIFAYKALLITHTYWTFKHQRAFAMISF